MTSESAINELNAKGFVIFDSFLNQKEIQCLKNDCIKWVDICGEYQINAGMKKDFTAHHSVGGDDSIDHFLHEHHFHEILTDFFDGKNYILHACNPVLGPPSAKSYLHKIHRDIRTFIPGMNLRINMLVALDEFTIENGATEIYVGSHLKNTMPSEEDFENNKSHLIMPAGSVVLFNSYLWHRAGYNSTNDNRVALTLSFGLSFIKPQMDYARLIGEDKAKNFSSISRQILGYNSRVPICLEEWYRKPENRLYHEDQG
jgi:ectoine hydroxylase-related dioxygenase (phytanoyl-CoA dioxygenase family)